MIQLSTLIDLHSKNEFIFLCVDCPSIKLTVKGKKTNKTKLGTSPVVQWLRTCLPMQGTQVQPLIWEDPT